jgi:hypothetical protein
VRLLFKASDELLAEHETRNPVEDLESKLGRPPLQVAPGDVETRRDPE